VLLVAKQAAATVAVTESVTVPVAKEAAVTTAHQDAVAAGVVSTATSILNTAECEEKCVIFSTDQEAAVVVTEACDNTVALAAETKAVAEATAVVMAAAASASKAVEMAASAAHAAKQAAVAITARDDQDKKSLSEHRRQQHKLNRLVSFIVHGGHRHRVRRESRAIGIVSMILGVTNNWKTQV
jgi:hypothetical protein